MTSFFDLVYEVQYHIVSYLFGFDLRRTYNVCKYFRYLTDRVSKIRLAGILELPRRRLGLGLGKYYVAYRRLLTAHTMVPGTVGDEAAIIGCACRFRYDRLLKEFLPKSGYALEMINMNDIKQMYASIGDKYPKNFAWVFSRASYMYRCSFLTELVIKKKQLKLPLSPLLEHLVAETLNGKLVTCVYDLRSYLPLAAILGRKDIIDYWLPRISFHAGWGGQEDDLRYESVSDDEEGDLVAPSLSISAGYATVLAALESGNYDMADYLADKGFPCVPLFKNISSAIGTNKDRISGRIIQWWLKRCYHSLEFHDFLTWIHKAIRNNRRRIVRVFLEYALRKRIVMSWPALLHEAKSKAMRRMIKRLQPW